MEMSVRKMCIRKCENMTPVWQGRNRDGWEEGEDGETRRENFLGQSFFVLFCFGSMFLCFLQRGTASSSTVSNILLSTLPSYLHAITHNRVACISGPKIPEEPASWPRTNHAPLRSSRLISIPVGSRWISTRRVSLLWSYCSFLQTICVDWVPGTALGLGQCQGSPVVPDRGSYEEASVSPTLEGPGQ